MRWCLCLKAFLQIWHWCGLLPAETQNTERGCESPALLVLLPQQTTQVKRKQNFEEKLWWIEWHEVKWHHRVLNPSLTYNFALFVYSNCKHNVKSALAFIGLHYGNPLPWLKHEETQPQLLILGLRATLMNATQINYCKANKQRRRKE